MNRKQIGERCARFSIQRTKNRFHMAVLELCYESELSVGEIYDTHVV